MLSYNSVIYKYSPIWLQEYIISSRFFVRKKIREGKMFRIILDKIRKLEYMEEDLINKYQLNQLLDILKYSLINIPHYQNIGMNININNLTNEDYFKFPILTKEDVVSDLDNFIDKNPRIFKFKSATSGTTGLSMVGYRDIYSIVYENAFIFRQLLWAGYNIGDERAWIRGDAIIPIKSNQFSEKFWRYNKADNMLMLSSYHISSNTALQYIKMLEQFDPVIIQAYPSSIGFLAEWMDANNYKYKGKRLKGIIVSSETLTDFYRKSLCRNFNTEIYDWYGNFERCVAIGTCENGNLHLLSDYSYTELIPQGDNIFEIVGTGFGNRLMPLIRYRIGDCVKMAKSGTLCSCGRGFPVVEKILGRVDDFIKTPDGKRVGMVINILDGVPNIIEGQIIQNQLNSVEVKLVVTPQFGESEKQKVKNRAAVILGPNIACNVLVVDQLERTEAGKLRAVICNV